MGIVEDVNDPRREGRIKVRIQGMYDGLKLEDIPYCYPFRDLAGKQFSVPAIGKMVNVIFPLGTEPIYLYSERYNVNLQRKLQSMTQTDYQNFISLLMDNRTQIYADDVELVLDYYVTSIKIKKSGINLILKDRSQFINLGSETANQSAILGDNFMAWMDEFIKTLLIPTSLVGNSGSPVLKPQIDALCTRYQALRKTRFLSDHVKIIDNK